MVWKCPPLHLPNWNNLWKWKMDNLGNGSQSYHERQAVGINIGEKLFERYCKEKGYHLTRVGFDEKDANVPNFFRLSKPLRYLPDYVVNTDTKTFIVNVKGTVNIKKEEIERVEDFEDWYSTPQAPLVYAFCLQSFDKPVFVSVEKLFDLWHEAKTDKQWNDGKIYRTLKVNK